MRIRPSCLSPILMPMVVVVIVVVILAQVGFSSAVPNPTVSGPIPVTAIPGSPSHNYIFFSSNHDLPSHGYVEEEYFFSGTANEYNTSSPTAAQPCPGCTGTVISSGHPYLTRMVVRRPANPSDFNGTVLVEWINVTNGFDAENQFFFSWEHILGAGYIWVGVSAQRVGVDALKLWSPSRYGTLDVTQSGTITNDALSYDIFSQAGQALRHPSGIDVLNGLRPRVMLAIGESQSAFRLAAYVNSIQPLANEYDGFVLLSTLGNLIRTDLTVPVWKILTEFDVASSEARFREPDTNRFRTWEVAGTSHVDEHLRVSREALELRDNVTSAEAVLAPQCANPTIGTRVPTTYVLASAYDLMVRWVTEHVPPPTAPRIQIATLGSPGVFSVIARNSLGLALGGIQLAQVAVPTAVNDGINSGPGACVRWGYYAPFDVTKLDQLYPTHNGYVNQVTQVTNDNVKNGYILDEDGQQTIMCSVYSNVGGSGNNGEQRRSLGEFLCDPSF
jgi:hypothetical protein